MSEIKVILVSSVISFYLILMNNDFLLMRNHFNCDKIISY